MIEVQIIKARIGWTINIKQDGRAVWASTGYYSRRAQAIAVAAEKANEIRAAVR